MNWKVLFPKVTVLSCLAIAALMGLPPLPASTRLNTGWAGKISSLARCLYLRLRDVISSWGQRHATAWKHASLQKGTS